MLEYKLSKVEERYRELEQLLTQAEIITNREWRPDRLNAPSGRRNVRRRHPSAAVQRIRAGEGRGADGNEGRVIGILGRIPPDGGR